MRGTLRARRATGLGLAVLALAGVTGCDLQEDADLERGRDLFVAQCGTCHKLAEAATTADVGPDLDSSFAAARAVGQDQDTIEGVVESQIENPRQTNVDPSDSRYSSVYMPADLVEGRDAEDVAAYVASVAGVPGIEPPTAPGGPGGQVYANNGCASCHTLKQAQSVGVTGPNLNESLVGQDAKSIENSIVNPDDEIVKGFANVMPGGYGDSIAADDMKLLVDFLAKSANKK